MNERALIYGRVSTDEQAETGYGLSYQINRGQAYCDARSYEVVKVITDDYTGKVAFRPGINEVLALIEPNKITVVVIDRTNRLGRRASVQETLETEIETRGARVEYVSEAYDRSTAQGRAMRRVKGVFDELDYESLIDLLKEHKVEAVKRGSIVVSGPLYGYRIVKEREPGSRRTITRLAVDEDEATYVRQIFAWYARGDETGEPLSIKAIVRKLEALGVPKRRTTAKQRGAWTTATVFDMLHNETYIGKWYYRRTTVVRDGANKIRKVQRPRDEWIEVAVPRLVSDDLFQQAQARGQQNLEQSKRNRKHTYLFSGMLRCDTCGRRFAGLMQRYKDMCNYYRCGRRSHQKWGTGCPDVDYKESAIDRVAWAWLAELITNPDQIERTLQQRQADVQMNNDRLKEQAQAIEAQIGRKQQEQSNIVRLYAKTPLDALEAEIVQLQRQIDDHQLEHTRISAQLEQALYTPEQMSQIKAVCAAMAEAIQVPLTLEEKRKIYQLLDFSARLTIEDGWQVAYVECIISAEPERLLIGEQRTPGSPEQNTEPHIASGLCWCAVLGRSIRYAVSTR